MEMENREFRTRVLDLGDGLNELCDDLYEATQEDLENNIVDELIARGKEKISVYEKLLKETSGGKREEVESYEHFIKEVRDFLFELDNNRGKAK
jgi:hypothetical protein